VKILGVDPAISVTGFGLIQTDGDKISLINCGKVSTHSQTPFSKRLEKIYDSLLRLVKRHKPSYVVVEKIYSHYKHPTTAYYLGQVQGLIYLICGKKGIPLVEYNSTRIKKAITGKGNASKLQVQRMVEYLLSLEKDIQYPDISDALSVAVAHAYIMKTQRDNFKF